MKKSFALLKTLSLFSCLTVMPALAQVKYLVVQCHDSSTLSFALSESPVITTHDGELTVSIGSEQVNIPIENMIHFTLSETSGMPVVTHHDVVLRREGDILFFFNLKKDDLISVYSTGGNLMLSGRADEAGDAVLDLSFLSGGIYICTTPSLSFKFVKN